MALYKVDTAARVPFFMSSVADPNAGITGLTSLAASLVQPGTAGFVASGATFEENGYGWYVAIITFDEITECGEWIMHVEDGQGTPTASPADKPFDVVAFDPADENSLGLANLDDTITSRLASVDYTAPDNTGIGNAAADAADAKTAAEAVQALLPADPASQSAVITSIETRLADEDYTAPDNAGISTASAAATAAQSAAEDAKAASEAVDDRLPSDPADESLLETAIATRAAPGDTMALTGTAIDAIHDESVEGAYTLRQIMRIMSAALGGKWSRDAQGRIRIRDMNDTKDRLVVTISSLGRITVVVDAS